MTADPAHEQPQTDARDADGLRRAAVLLVALGDELGGQLLAQLDRSLVEQLGAAVATLGPVRAAEREAVLQDFLRVITEDRFESGGLDYLRALLERSRQPEEAAQILQDLDAGGQRSPFEFLRKADPRNLLTYIQEEHPQTIALILAHLPPVKAAEVLRGLSGEKQAEVTRRIATMGETTPDAVQDVERGIASRLSSLVEGDVKRAGDVNTAAEILNRIDRSTERVILEALQNDDPTLVDAIRRRMFVFEDIVHVNDRGMQLVIREFGPEDWALALKTAGPEIKQKVYRNLTDRAVAVIEDEIEYLGVVRLRDVEAAQQRIVDAIRRLEESGDVIIEGRGTGEPMVG